MRLDNQKGDNDIMDTIKFHFDETGEDVLFVVIGSIDYNDETYVLVVEEEEIENDDMTAYILKVTGEDGDDVLYEIVDDDDELAEVSSKFDDVLENFDID